MAVCHKCGGTVTASDKKCPNCGAKVKRKKGEGGNAALLIIFLVVLLGFGGAIVYFMYRDSRPQLGTFDCNCDAFTGAVNRLLDGDENTTLHLDARKWKVDREHTVVIYDGGSFTLKVKTAKNNDISSKIRELRVGPTNTEDGVTMAALSISALEKGVSKDTALYDLGNVKALLRDKMSYDAVSFTFDREKDEFVLVPSSGNRSPEQLAATDDEASSLVVSNSVFVSGDRFIEAGGKYIFTNGDGIRFRDKITDNNTKFSDAKNDGQLLSDGTVVYYVTDTGKQRRVCSAKLDGSEEKTLFEVEGNVRLLHFTNKCLYYVTSSADKPRSFLFSKYRLDTNRSRPGTSSPAASCTARSPTASPTRRQRRCRRRPRMNSTSIRRNLRRCSPTAMYRRTATSTASAIRALTHTRRTAPTAGIPIIICTPWRTAS